MERAYLGGRAPSGRGRVPTSVQPRSLAPSEPSGAGGPARRTASRALPALREPAGRRRRIRPPRVRLRRAAGRAGVRWVGWARRRSARCRQLRGSADARRQWLEPCPFLPRALPAPVPPSSSTQRAGEGPTPGAPAAQLLGCAGSRARRAHSLPLGANSPASMARALRGWWVRAPQRWAARGARGPGGRRPAARGLGWRLRTRTGGQVRPRPRRRSVVPATAARWSCPGRAQRAPPPVRLPLRARPPRSPVMSGGGEG